MPWPTPSPLPTASLDLVPLSVDHAREMVDVLADPALYAFTGGEPPTLDQLGRRYAAQLAGPADGRQGWLNWVLRDRSTGALVGFVQATVEHGSGGWTAEVAWVVGAPFQGRGVATEAARAVTAWLSTQGVTTVRAHVHPGHPASRAVAERIGLTATGVLVDGEELWVAPGPGRAGGRSTASVAAR